MMVDRKRPFLVVVMGLPFLVKCERRGMKSGRAHVRAWKRARTMAEAYSEPTAYVVL